MMTEAVNTVLGPVDSKDLGICLAHEHLVIDYGELLGVPKQVPVADSSIEKRIIANVRNFASADGTLLVDCTPPGYGRYPDLMAKVSSETGVHIVGCTGGFTEQPAPLHPVTESLDVETLSEVFIRELTEGMGGTRYRAGAIKVATSEEHITEGEARILQAAAQAQLETGSPIITHTSNGLGPEQVDFLAARGVDAGKIIVGHMGFEQDPKADILAVLQRGANVAFDRIGHQHFFPDTHWLELIRFVLDRGFQDRLVLSHDAVTEFYGPEEMRAYTFGDYTYIVESFLPALREAGVDAQVVNCLLQENPRTAFIIQKPDDHRRMAR